MLLFSAQFPLASQNSITDLLLAGKHWVAGSPHSNLPKEEIFSSNDHEASIVVGGERFQLLSYIAEQTEFGGIRYAKEENELRWITDITGRKTEEGFWVSIQVACDSAMPIDGLPTPKTPYIIKNIFRLRQGGTDGKLTASDFPVFLRSKDIGLAADLVLGKGGCKMPVVYVSACNDNQPYVDPKLLARKLVGLAHVVVEPTRKFSHDLLARVHARNVYGGSIGVYWPEGIGQTAFVPGERYNSPRDIIREIVSLVTRAVAAQRPLQECSWAQLQELVSRNKVESLQAAGSTEIESYIEAFDAEVKAKDEALAAAEAEIFRLKSALQSASKVQYTPSASRVGVLVESQEQELYAGERLEILREAIERRLQECEPNKRKADVLQDFLVSNQFETEKGEIQDRIRAALKKSIDMDKKTRRALEQVGFEFSEEGKHIKAVFRGDSRYVFTFPKTSSDHRAGMNMASDILKTLF